MNTCPWQIWIAVHLLGSTAKAERERAKISHFPNPRAAARNPPFFLSLPEAFGAQAILLASMRPVTMLVFVDLPPLSNWEPDAPKKPVKAEPDTLREDLEECLANIETRGSFSVFGILESPPNPGLCLKNGGQIGLPLSDRDARAIITASHKAPFGKGRQTIVDTKIRNTWEISHDAFQITHPAWDSFLRSIVVKVSGDLESM